MPVNAEPDVDAVVLVGGQGTRLRPLTLSRAKPMLPTAGVPFLAHLLSRIASAGVRHVVLGTSYLADTFADYFGDGAQFGLELEYVVEDEPLGTGGGIRNVASRLRASTTLVFNGDVLAGTDLRALLATHRGAGADVTLHLVRVADPRAFGCVPTTPEGRVTAFLEKTENPPTDQINAGCYVFRREVLEQIPAGRPVSVERETFPGLLAAGNHVQAHVDAAYWRDFGTPADLVAGSADLVRGLVPSAALPGPTGPALVLERAQVATDAVISGGSTIGAGAVVEAGARVDGALLFDGAVVGEGAIVERSVLGVGARVAAGAHVRGAVLGDRSAVGERCELLDGLRLWPDVELPAGSVRFSAEV